MKKRNFEFIILIMILIVPFFVYAASLTTYGESITKANNYILNYNDRRKFLIFNKKYVYEKSGYVDNSSFKTGGMLSKSEFDLSVLMNQSYLASGKEYWTTTQTGNSNYYVDAYLQTKSKDSLSGTRVTQYVKPSTVAVGSGTYANPWVFSDGYEVDVISIEPSSL